MPLRPPTREVLRELGEMLYLDLTEDELAFYREEIARRTGDYETVRSYVPDRRLGGAEVRERSLGHRSRDDPHNAWVTRCEVRGADDGDLSGWEVAIKDNVCVAGVAMTCGSAVVEGYAPPLDATVVTRLLDAGATVVGKTNMDDMAMSVTGHSTFGPITNPHDDDYLAGGSSGGSAVAVATGEVDAAIGTDQGGSVRIPAAYCGVVGHKPTYGLVPYSGIVGLEHVVDHPGPMGADVETVASVLSVVAGTTDHDPRQPRDLPDRQYEEELDGDVSDLSIALLEEGFERPDGDAAVERRVRGAIDHLEDRGASVGKESVPLHDDAEAVHSVLEAEGLVAAVAGEGLGHGTKGWYNTSWVDAFGKFRRALGDEFPASLKLPLLMGAYTGREYHSRYYARAMNLIMDLGDRYDAVLEEYDLLAMPTTAMTPPEHTGRDEFTRLREAPEARNTSSFNRTGHPAVSVPAGAVDGLPVGLMLVGSRFEDATVLDAAFALERELESD